MPGKCAQRHTRHVHCQKRPCAPCQYLSAPAAVCSCKQQLLLAGQSLEMVISKKRSLHCLLLLAADRS